jgi:hypothetical protein
VINPPVFIDWLSIAQRHYLVDLPIVGDGVSMKCESYQEFDNDGEKLLCVVPGETFRYSVPSVLVKGSHSTAVRVRSDGSNVTLSGNPGRYDRPDNVFNYGIEETVKKASGIVAGYSLPAFSAGECLAKTSVNERDRDLGLWYEWTGAVIRELHATVNYSAGNEALAKEYMQYAGSLRAARIAKGVFGDETIVYGALAKKGKTFHKAIVIYRKAEEMLAHAKGPEAKEAVKKSPEYELARDTGLVRVECKWGSHFLRDNGLRFLGEMKMGKIVSIFMRETAFLRDASPERAVRLVSDMPTKLRLAALAWIRGDDLRVLMSRATFFRVVKSLRDYGLDVSERRSGQVGLTQAESDLQVMLAQLPCFDLRPLACPEWYGLPEIELERMAA